LVGSSFGGVLGSCMAVRFIIYKQFDLSASLLALVTLILKVGFLGTCGGNGSSAEEPPVLGGQWPGGGTGRSLNCKRSGQRSRAAAEAQNEQQTAFSDRAETLAS